MLFQHKNRQHHFDLHKRMGFNRAPRMMDRCSDWFCSFVSCFADIHEGNLKSILTLFFNISRYKQVLKGSGTPSPGSHPQQQTPFSSQQTRQVDSGAASCPLVLASPFSSNTSLASNPSNSWNTSNGNMAASGGMVSRYGFEWTGPLIPGMHGRSVSHSDSGVFCSHWTVAEPSVPGTARGCGAVALWTRKHYWSRIVFL